MGRKLTVGARGNQALSQWQVKFTKTPGKEELDKMNEALGVFSEWGQIKQRPPGLYHGAHGGDPSVEKRGQIQERIRLVLAFIAGHMG